MSRKRVIEPYLLAVLSSRLNGIGKEMATTLTKTARSGVMNIAKDLSTGICDSYGDALSIPITSIHIH